VSARRDVHLIEKSFEEKPRKIAKAFAFEASWFLEKKTKKQKKQKTQRKRPGKKKAKKEKGQKKKKTKKTKHFFFDFFSEVFVYIFRGGAINWKRREK
jgi:hypothetical protein